MEPNLQVKSKVLAFICLLNFVYVKGEGPLQCQWTFSGRVAVPVIPSRFFTKYNAYQEMQNGLLTRSEPYTNYTYPLTSAAWNSCSGYSAALQYCYFSESDRAPPSGRLLRLGPSRTVWSNNKDECFGYGNSFVCCGTTRFNYKAFYDSRVFSFQTVSSNLLQFTSEYLADRHVTTQGMAKTVGCGGLLLLRIEMTPRFGTVISRSRVRYCTKPTFLPISPQSSTVSKHILLPSTRIITPVKTRVIKNISVETLQPILLLPIEASFSTDFMLSLSPSTQQVSMSSDSSNYFVSNCSSTLQSSEYQLAQTSFLSQPTVPPTSFNTQSTLLPYSSPSQSHTLLSSTSTSPQSIMTQQNIHIHSSATASRRSTLSPLPQSTSETFSPRYNWHSCSLSSGCLEPSQLLKEGIAITFSKPFVGKSQSFAKNQAKTNTYYIYTNSETKSAIIGGTVGGLLLLVVFAMFGMMYALYKYQRKLSHGMRRRSNLDTQSLMRYEMYSLTKKGHFGLIENLSESPSSVEIETPQVEGVEYNYISSFHYQNDPEYSHSTSYNIYDDITTPAARHARYSNSSPEVLTSVSYDALSPPVGHRYETADTSADIYVVPAQGERALYQQMDTMRVKHLEHDSLRLGAKIGSGNFGEVFKGLWLRGSGEVEVAIKTLKMSATQEDRIKFLQEAAIMIQFKHPNVVEMYGVALNTEPTLLVLEFLARGDLLHQLLKLKSMDRSLVDCYLLSYGLQVASGMMYLSQIGFVHRDLAARNVLVSQDNICKIADFGMSRVLMEDDYYKSHGGVVPVKWTSPEALRYKKYSVASDVWSFGVVLYEIWSMGTKPYSNVSNRKVLQMIDAGFRMTSPSRCPNVVYRIMLSCWHPVPSLRPTFKELHEQLSSQDTRTLSTELNRENTMPEHDSESSHMMRDVL